ncbi:hypothetical protein [Aurantiacibacter sp. D1-12]|uniref:hypothetical protein n=1 Tax=Aurantiacibacter sp. D1-12 TaxID=2993658 RepID=UPI00237CFE8C|nr:hypothetical protein [Aurantiacibacter sp. D1-12]MDE1466598.1 hypothetical protein [Aurantiacibacter sp. D1-12]
MNVLRAGTAGFALVAACAATSAQAEIVIGPRVAYYFDNSNLRSTDLNSIQNTDVFVNEVFRDELEAFVGVPVNVLETGFSESQRAEQIGFAMYGGMINFGNDRDRFTVTAMYGSGSGAVEVVSTRSVEVTFLNSQINDLEVRTLTGETQIDRLDIEATWQRRVNENFAITAGVRYERLDRTDTAAFNAVASDQIVTFLLQDPNFTLNSFPGEFDLVAETGVETFTARFGGTAFVPIDDSINAFFSGMVQAGYQPDSEQLLSTAFNNGVTAGTFTDTGTETGEISFGPDMAVGLQFLLGQDVAIDVRYRAVVIFPLTGEFDFSDARVNHGVNLGISFRL